MSLLNYTPETTNHDVPVESNVTPLLANILVLLTGTLLINVYVPELPAATEAFLIIKILPAPAAAGVGNSIFWLQKPG